MVEIHQHELGPLLNAFNEGICALNQQGELLYYNEVAKKHWNADLLLNHKLLSQAPVIRALAGERTTHELVHVSEDHVLLVNMLPLYGDTSSVVGVVIVSQDVTEHVVWEQQAQSSLNVLLEAVLDTQNLGDIDETLRRIAALLSQLESVDNSIAFRVNKEATKLLPIAHFSQSQESQAEWQAELTALKLSAEHALDPSSPAYVQALHLGRSLQFDFTSSSSLSNPRKLHAAIYAPVFLDGRVIGMLGAERHRRLGAIDNTYFPQWSVELLTALARLASMSIERTTLMNSLERTQGELETARELLSQTKEFLSLASHELKNPLTAIRGQAQVLHRRIHRIILPGSEQVTHDLLRGLESIDHQTRRIEHLINNLLNVNQVDMDRFEAELREIDLVQLAQRTLEELLPLMKKHKLHFFVNGKPVPIVAGKRTVESSIKMQGDEEQLEQALTNLITNAVKYSPENGPIIVSLQYIDGDFIELAVEDRGIGIPPAEQAKLTERFYRATNAQGGGMRGLGLGLYIVNVFVAKHKGSLSIKSEGIPGQGSVFIVKLPYQKP